MEPVFFFIDSKHILTCLHVVVRAEIQPNNNTAVVKFGDLKISTSTGETLAASLVSLPLDLNSEPAQYDFGIIQVESDLKSKPNALVLATDDEAPEVGDDVVFSGYPLGVPGMVSHRGMVSGFAGSGAEIFIEAPVNKGNSGGALLNEKGHVVGTVCNRWGGISQDLNQLSQFITRGESQGGVSLMGVNPLEAIKALIGMLDTY